MAIKRSRLGRYILYIFDAERAVQYHSSKYTLKKKKKKTLFTFIAVRPLGRPVLPVRKDMIFETVEIFVTQKSCLF